PEPFLRQMRRRVRQTAKLPMEGAVARHDVARRAPRDHSDVDARIGWIEAAGRVALLTQLRADSLQLADELASDVNGAHAFMQIGGMNLEAAHARRMRRHALMGVRH